MARHAAKYRYITRKGKRFIYQRVVDGKRHRETLAAATWDEAADAARAIDRDLDPVPRPTRRPALDITFNEACEDYLASSAAAPKSASTRYGLGRLLDPAAPLRRDLGGLALDEVTVGRLERWWRENVDESATRSTATGQRHLTAASGVFKYASDEGWFGRDAVEETAQYRNPVEGLRRRLANAPRGKHQASTPTSNPIEDPAALRRFLETAAVARKLRAGGKPTKEPDLTALVVVLLMVDAGLRMGEVGALRWGQVKWGQSADDPTRAIVVDRALSRGIEERTKSGRVRTVPLSRRLRAALRELWMAQGRPAGKARVLPGVQWTNWRGRVLRRLLRDADGGTGALYDPETKRGRFSPHDLRDTFASWLLSLGVPVAEVAYYLGHRETSTTERHYARWVWGARRVRPPELGPTDVTPDLLAAVGAEDSESGVSRRPQKGLKGPERDPRGDPISKVKPRRTV